MYNEFIDNEYIDNDLIVTLKAIKILNNSPYFDNDKICALYKRLFDKLYLSKNQESLFIMIWLNHITEQLSRTADLLTHCETISNGNNGPQLSSFTISSP